MRQYPRHEIIYAAIADLKLEDAHTDSPPAPVVDRSIGTPVGGLGAGCVFRPVAVALTARCGSGGPGSLLGAIGELCADGMEARGPFEQRACLDRQQHPASPRDFLRKLDIIPTRQENLFDGCVLAFKSLDRHSRRHLGPVARPGPWQSC